MMFLCSLSLFIIMIVHNHVLFSINAALLWFVDVFTESCVSQSISPLEEKVDAVEGETVTLSCRYEGSVYNLQWYRQYPGSRPEYLLMINPSTKGVSYANPRIPRLDGAVNGSVVDLEISSAAVSDSVLYYCALEPTVTGNPDTLYRNCKRDVLNPAVTGTRPVNTNESCGMWQGRRCRNLCTDHSNQGTQTPPPVDKQSCVSQSISPLEEKVDAVEGQTVTLSCSYEKADYLFWYRQYPGSSPDFLQYISPYRAKSDPPPRMSAEVKESNGVDLKISSAAVSDSVLYYCALEPTVTGNPDTLYSNWFYRNLLTILIITSGVFGADVIRPSENQETDISRKEGETLTLKCTYDTSSENVVLYWYRQYPNRAPQYLLLRGARGRSDSDSSDGRFSTITSRTSTDLTVRELRVADTALYYCALRRSFPLEFHNESGAPGSRETHGHAYLAADWSISPVEEKVDAVEGQTVTLSCSYEGGGTGPSLHWYRQYPGSRPEFLLLTPESGAYVNKAEKPDARMSIKVHKEETKKVDLEISSAAVSDSVLYYCALAPTVTGNPDTLRNPGHKGVQSIVQIQNPQSTTNLDPSDLLPDPLIHVGGVSTCWNSRTQISPHYLNTGTTMMFLCSLSLFIIMIESCVSQSISPLEEKVDAVEGETVTLSCSYEYSGSYTLYLYWYHHYPGSRPEFLLLTSESGGYVNKANNLDARISIKVHKAEKKVYLEISSSKISDSVLYYCALRPTVTRSPSTLYKNSLTDKALRCVWGFLSGAALCISSTQRGVLFHNHVLFSINAALLWFVYVFTERCVSQSISPLEEKVDAVEGETVTLSCRYEYSGTDTLYLHWYRQYPGSRPEFLLLTPESGAYVTEAEKTDARMSIKVHKEEKKLYLKISSAALSDSVLYYCALAPTVTGNPDTLYRNWFYD
ncbi:hypothetical protein NFI96_029733 [Prochilodus magdalenae]|nr:hypothetical protein NFI96_029733 [Prochilodus magdalenae]